MILACFLDLSRWARQWWRWFWSTTGCAGGHNAPLHRARSASKRSAGSNLYLRFEFLLQLHSNLPKRHSPLLGRVAVADGDGVVLQGLAVNGDAEGSAGFVLAAITAADGAFIVVKDVELFFEIAIER